jgi:hypothetical protein
MRAKLSRPARLAVLLLAGILAWGLLIGLSLLVLSLFR